MSQIEPASGMPSGVAASMPDGMPQTVPLGMLQTMPSTHAWHARSGLSKATDLEEVG
jgi:hypothetical protein